MSQILEVDENFLNVTYHTKSQVKKLIKRLSGLSGRTFQNASYDVLKNLWPDLVQSADLRDFDRAGIDLYLPQDQGGEFEVVVQAKGFEKLEFDESHLSQCLKSVAAFRRSGHKSKLYLLVINRRFVPGALHRESLRDALATLESEGVVRRAYYLDLQRFVNFLYLHLRRVVAAEIAQRNRHLLAQFSASMGGDLYVPDVPFVVAMGRAGEDVATRASDGPLRYISQHIEMRLAKQKASPAGYYLPKAWTLLAGEFGFGKTALMLHLAGELERAGCHALYLPVALVPPEGFATETSFVRCVLQFIMGEKEIDSEVAHVWDTALADILRCDSSYVLCIDGLDEHRDAYQRNGLRQMFGCLRDLTRDVVVSARKEFWDERWGSVTEALRDESRARVELGTWDDATILRYVDRASRREDDKGGLSRLRDLVASRAYEAYYGDIPRRPLFLAMLARDLNCSGPARRNIADLYRAYFLEKMGRDGLSPFLKGVVGGRPEIASDRDLFDEEHRAMLMLENLAWSTCVALEESSKVGLLEVFPEGMVADAAVRAGLPGTSVLPYLMRTILVTVRERSRNHPTLELRFAHRSYQEFFVASRIVKSAREEGVGLNSEEMKRYPPAVQMFAEQL